LTEKNPALQKSTSFFESCN